MDKGFFRALILSLSAIAVSQILFPPAKPLPSSQRNGAVKDSGPVRSSVSSTVDSSSIGGRTGILASELSRTEPTKGAIASTARSVAETTIVTTPRAIYKFSNVGANPVSVVVRDYKNRSGTDGPVQMGSPGNPRLSYRLITPTDTADLSQISFALTRAQNGNGDQTLAYSGSVGPHLVSISYVMPRDTSLSYIVRVDGQVSNVQSPAYLITDLPKTMRPTEADTVADHRTLAYSFKPIRDHARSVLFGSLDPGEKTLEPGPLNWVAIKNKYFVFGVLSLPNGSPFSEATLIGGPRTSKIATNASAGVVQEIRNGRFSYEFYGGPQESQRLMRVG